MTTIHKKGRLAGAQPSGRLKSACPVHQALAASEGNDETPETMLEVSIAKKQLRDEGKRHTS